MGISLSGSLALKPEIFRADLKYKEARLIEDFLNPKENPSEKKISDFQNFILEFSKALGLHDMKKLYCQCHLSEKNKEIND